MASGGWGYDSVTDAIPIIGDYLKQAFHKMKGESYDKEKEQI